jgi:NAD(P)-dependent dehydrogenase (short-subunit alcohol dehydrogenase family)
VWRTLDQLRRLRTKLRRRDPRAARREAELEALVAEIASEGGEAVFLAGDVQSEDFAKALVALAVSRSAGSTSPITTQACAQACRAAGRTRPLRALSRLGRLVVHDGYCFAGRRRCIDYADLSCWAAGLYLTFNEERAWSGITRP